MTPKPSIQNPFPGLRPFREDEDYLFFGREAQTAELLTRLRKSRFIAVVGPSGSGKSSLVRAGLLPALHGGGMTRAGSAWEIVLMRPGGDPITHLAQGLIDADCYDPDDAESLPRVRATLSRSRQGLVEAARQSKVSPAANLLVVVDQFEELFRFRRGGVAHEEEAGAFARLLLTASEQEERRIFIALTMRSDYLGDCSRIPGLAEAVNRGEYLIPRLSRAQRRDAIEKPVSVAGGRMAPRLAQKLLNDVGDDPDQLPILQHALMRTWDCWAASLPRAESGIRDTQTKPGTAGASAATAHTRRPIDLEDYQATGGMTGALSRHADEVYTELPADSNRRLAERLFKALTERGPDNRGIRRPARLDPLSAILDAPVEEIVPVIEAFRRAERTFLMPMVPAALTPDTVIDISHESLMRVWMRLRHWVEEEARSARVYRRLAETAHLHAEGKAGHYHDPDLQIALTWREQDRPGAAWAERYHPGFDTAMAFLDASREARDAEAEAREAARQHELKQARALAEAQRERAEEQKRSANRLKWFVRGLGLVAMIALAALAAAMLARNEAKTQAQHAREQARLARAASEKADTLLLQYQLEEGKSWLARARSYFDQKNFFYARLMAGRAIGFEGHGRGSQDEAFRTSHPVLLRPENPERDQAERLLRTAPDHGLLWQSPLGVLHESHVSRIAYSPDGTLMATASGEFDLPEPSTTVAADHSIRIWDVATGALLGSLPGQSKNTVAMNFGPEGQSLVAVSDDGIVQVIDVSDREVVQVIDVSNREVVQVIDVSNREVVRGSNMDAKMALFLFQGGHYFLSPRNRFLAVADPRNAIQIWDIATGTRTRTLTGHTGRVFSVAFHPDQPLIVSGARDGTVRLWNLSAGESVGDRVLFKSRSIWGISSLAFSPNGSKLAIGETAQSPWRKVHVHLWDLASRTIEKTWGGHRGFSYNLTFSPDGRLLVSTDITRHLRFLDVESGKELADYQVNSNELGGVAFSPDGETLGASDGNSVRFFKRPFGDRTVQPETEGHTGAVSDVAISRDGCTMASSGEGGSIRLWEVATGKQIGRLSGHEGAVTSLNFSPDGALLVYGGGDDSVYSGSDNTVRVWDVAGRKQVHALEGHILGIASVCFSPDGRWIVSGSYDRMIKLWDSSTGNLIKTLTGHTNSVNGVCFSPDGRRIASASDDRTLRLWDPESGRNLMTLTGHDDAVRCVAVSPDGNLLASGSKDQTLRLWDAETGSLLRTISGHTKTVTSISFSPGGNRLASGSDDGTARLWDVSTGKPICVYAGHRSGVTRVRFGPDGRILATASRDGQVRLWKVFPERERTLWRAAHASGIDSGVESVTAMAARISSTVSHASGIDSGVESVTLSPDGRIIASAGGDALIRLWNSATGQELRTLRGHARTIWSLGFSPAGRWIASGGLDGQLKIWDVSSGKELRTLDRDPIETGSVVFSPDGRWLAFGDAKSKVNLWSTANWTEIHQLAAHTSGLVHSVAFSPDSRLLASGGADGKVILWDVESGEKSMELTGHSDHVFAVSFSPDGTRLASGSGDARIKLWDVASGKELQTIADHAETVHGLAFHPNGRILVSSSSDRTVRLWDLNDGSEIATLSGHTGAVKGLALSPDGKLLISGALDGTVRLWDIEDLLRPPAPLTGYLDWARLDGRNVIWKGTKEQLYASLRGPWFQSSSGSYLDSLTSGEPADAIRRDLFRRFLAAHNWPGARRVLDQISGNMIRERLALANSLETAGQTQLRDQHPRSARWWLRQAVALDSESIPSRRLLARAEFQDGDLKQAGTILENVLQADPSASEDWDLRGRIDEALERWDDAYQAYSKAIELFQERSEANPVAYLRDRARLLERMGRTEEAVKDRLVAHDIPLRNPDTPPGLIDLSLHYNAALTENWHGIPENNLADLKPFGVQELGGVAFDVRGVIQLNSAVADQITGLHFPAEVKGISVGCMGKSVHFLHAAGWGFGGAAGTLVARYVIHYAGGQSRPIEIKLGQDLRDWWFDGSAPPSKEPMTVVWTGTNRRVKARLGSEGRLRLFKTTWINPRPEVEIQSIDLISAMDESAVFIIAITVE